ncbi:transcription factor HES-2 [Phodopus roborovskii]|uniref:Hes2 protein n=1 Tax=Phodopus roborovskii TaxID=109678 RepID=A0AAV0ACC9_PHORO|nr:transcription factor HES-2 [Phodopus roborovskii]CAH7447512.1 Hes2 [Phodopus roborovskii]
MRVPRTAGDAAELRKTLKPLLEKRRRARINESLSQLKGLVLPMLGAETSRYSKLEKADILEMTVRFLQEQPYHAAAPEPLDSYLEGYRACLARLARVLPACSVLEPAVSMRLLEHLRQRTVSGGSTLQTPTPAPTPAPAPSPSPPPQVPHLGSPGLWRPW